MRGRRRLSASGEFGKTVVAKGRRGRATPNKGGSDSREPDQRDACAGRSGRAVDRRHSGDIYSGSMQSLVELLAPWGALRSQPLADWRGPPHALPDMVAAFYRDVGPWGAVVHERVGPVGLTISKGGNPVVVPPLSGLWGLQAGYAWSRDPDVPLPGWRPNWLVIATDGANPFMFDRDDGRIHFAFAGRGAAGWQPRLFAHDLVSGLGAIATVANSLAELGDDARDDDFDLRPESREYVRGRLAGFLGSADRASLALESWKLFA